MDNSNNRQQNESLGVNKMGKNTRKSPLHQPKFANNGNRPQPPQPQVYNISKNDFRNIVQQLTGSPSQETLPRPPQNSPKPQSMRLQKIRPPPLTPITRPHIPPLVPPPAVAPPPVPFNNSFVRPGQFGQPSPACMPPGASGDPAWANMAESPVSAYINYLQRAMLDPTPRGVQAQPSVQTPQAQAPGYVQPLPPSSALLPTPPMPALSSPRLNGTVRNIPVLQMNGHVPLPSRTLQYLLPSPTGYINTFSPWSPHPLFSPGIQFPPPLTPTFPFSPIAQPGILGPGPLPPSSPRLVFPPSPTGFFPLLSPGWRDQ